MDKASEIWHHIRAPIPIYIRTKACVGPCRAELGTNILNLEECAQQAAGLLIRVDTAINARHFIGTIPFVERGHR